MKGYLHGTDIIGAVDEHLQSRLRQDAARAAGLPVPPASEYIVQGRPWYQRTNWGTVGLIGAGAAVVVGGIVWLVRR